MQRAPRELYIDLMTQTLSFSLWPEPPIPIEALNSTRSLPKRIVASLLSKIVGFTGLQLVRDRRLTPVQRVEGQIWPGYADTMIGLRRLENLRHCVETAIREDVPGDFIETGVWRGGSCIFMRAILAAYGVHNRRVFVADSFEGLPRPDPVKNPVDRGDVSHRHPFLAVSLPEVQANFEKYGLLDHQVVFLKGWFRDTLPTAPIDRLAILRLDGDMYGSTMDALVNLYPKLSVGGFCIIDDYALPTCKAAVDDYLRQQRIVAELQPVDWTGRFWRKEPQSS